MKCRRASLLALCIVLAAAAPGRAFAQADNYGKPVDLKPMLPPIIPPLLPPNSLLTPGPVSSGTQSPYSSAPLYDPTQSQATPGLRLTIPSR
jgi:hypothetical protein